MSPKSKKHVTVASIVAAASLVFGGLGAMGNGLLAFDAKMNASEARSDSLYLQVSALTSGLSQTQRHVRRLERIVGVSSSGFVGPPSPPQRPQGRGGILGIIKSVLVGGPR